MTTVSAERLAQVFVAVSDTLVDDFDLVDFLQMLALRTAELAAASVVGIVLADAYGHLQFMAGSQENARLLELFQLQNDEGPCLDAFRATMPVVNTDEDIAIVQSLADMASIALLQERAIRRSEILTEQLQGALNSRVIIEQAKGAVAQANGVSVDAAFDAIRAYARAHNRRLSEVAHAVVTTPDAVSGLLRR